MGTGQTRKIDHVVLEGWGSEPCGIILTFQHPRRGQRLGIGINLEANGLINPVYVMTPQ